jgi:glycosyltransferase involved in cell wall biosynthesis
LIIQSNKFSVLISVYNNIIVTDLDLALKSLIEQTLQPSQIVIVLDGTVSSRIFDLISEFKRRTNVEINIVQLASNQGLGKALFEGLKYCKFELIARMDTDDFSNSNRFAKQIEFMNLNPEISVLGSWVTEFNEIPGDLNRLKKVPEDHQAILTYSKYRNPLNHPTVVFRKSHVLAAGSYQSMPFFEDYFLWARMIKMGYKFHNLRESLLHFRVGNSMIGRRHGIMYLIHEFNFLINMRKMNFLSLIEFIANLIIRLPLRILPLFILKLIYKTFLR